MTAYEQPALPMMLPGEACSVAYVGLTRQRRQCGQPSVAYVRGGCEQYGHVSDGPTCQAHLRDYRLLHCADCSQAGRACPMLILEVQQ